MTMECGERCTSPHLAPLISAFHLGHTRIFGHPNIQKQQVENSLTSFVVGNHPCREEW